MSELRPLLDALANDSRRQETAASMRSHVVSALNAGKIPTAVRVSFADLFPDTASLLTSPGDYAIYNAIANRIVVQAGPSAIVATEKNRDLLIILFSSAKVDTTLYFAQLLRPLTAFFGVQRISRIQASEIGLPPNVDDLLQFLSGAS